jgi:cytochrome c5
LIHFSVISILYDFFGEVMHYLMPLCLLICPLSLSQAASNEPVEAKGKSVYDKYCTVCHQNGVAGAPKFRDAKTWEPFLAKDSDLDALTPIAIKGKNAMPPKGTCQECTDSDIKAAIQYMRPQK